jgi:hypothetical protein
MSGTYRCAHTCSYVEIAFRLNELTSWSITVVDFSDNLQKWIVTVQIGMNRNLNEHSLNTCSHLHATSVVTPAHFLLQCRAESISCNGALDSCANVYTIESPQASANVRSFKYVTAWYFCFRGYIQILCQSESGSCYCHRVYCCWLTNSSLLYVWFASMSVIDFLTKFRILSPVLHLLLQTGGQSNFARPLHYFYSARNYLNIMSCVFLFLLYFPSYFISGTCDEFGMASGFIMSILNSRPKL